MRRGNCSHLLDLTIRMWWYNAALLLGALFWIFKSWRQGKIDVLKAQLFPRFAEPTTRPVIWMHAVSVGETLAMASLATKLKAQHPKSYFIVTSMSKTGHERAKKAIAFADAHYYLPVDLSWIITPIVNRVCPDLVVISENDLWLHFLMAAKRVGARVVLVNGKLSERSLKRLKWCPFFTDSLLSTIDVFCVQNDIYSDRFIQLGVPKEKIFITGNLKLDAAPPCWSEEEKGEWRKRFGLAGAPVIVLGSTHHPEEIAILEVLALFDVKILLVPRHPERFIEVEALLKKRGETYGTFSAPNPTASIHLIDKMGQLMHCYALADLAIVGGSFFSGVGGHNICEPCLCGVPVLFGPYMHTQQELVDAVLAKKAGKQLSMDQLQEVVGQLLSHPIERQQMAVQGMELVTSMRGGTDRTFFAVDNLWSKE